METIRIVEEVEGGVEAELSCPPCPDCGTSGVYVEQMSEIVDGRFTIIDAYICPKCYPEALA